MDDDRPIPEYAALAAAFWAVFALFLATNRDRLPDRMRPADVLGIALSSYKLSRLITKEDVTAFVRVPVTEDAAAQRPKPDGMARVLGELLTCPYCIGLWITSGLAYAQVVFPRETRFFTSIFGSYAATDFLHAGFVRLRGSE
jgi:Protein of unknown function (DUF1360)